MNVSCELLLVSFKLRVLCCCLLSRISETIDESLTAWLVRKTTMLTLHQEHTFLILDCTQQQLPVLDIHSTVRKMCFSLSLDHQPSQRQNIQ